MTITYHHDITQNTPEWLAIRNGLLTASEIRLIMSPKTFKPADNEKTRAHAFELAAQRINGPRPDQARFQSSDMLRGHEEEELARDLYIEHFDDVEQVGFITNDDHGVTLGYSPDGIVRGKKRGIECKSRVAKYQIQTAHEWLTNGTISEDYIIQVHSGILIADLDGMDLISYSNGMDMMVLPVERDREIEEAIIASCIAFEAKVQAAIDSYNTVKNSADIRTVPTRYIERDIIV